MRDCSIPQVEMIDEDGEVHVVSSGLDARGRELPDPVPMAPPVGYSSGPSLADYIRSMLRGEYLRARAEAEGFDTPEEADDFDIADDPLDPMTPYEEHFMPRKDYGLDLPLNGVDPTRSKASPDQAGSPPGSPAPPDQAGPNSASSSGGSGVSPEVVAPVKGRS